MAAQVEADRAAQLAALCHEIKVRILCPPCRTCSPGRAGGFDSCLALLRNQGCGPQLPLTDTHFSPRGFCAHNFKNPLNGIVGCFEILNVRHPLLWLIVLCPDPFRQIHPPQSGPVRARQPQSS